MSNIEPPTGGTVGELERVGQSGNNPHVDDKSQAPTRTELHILRPTACQMQRGDVRGYVVKELNDNVDPNDLRDRLDWNECPINYYLGNERVPNSFSRPNCTWKLVRIPESPTSVGALDRYFPEKSSYLVTSNDNLMKEVVKLGRLCRKLLADYLEELNKDATPSDSLVIAGLYVEMCEWKKQAEDRGVAGFEILFKDKFFPKTIFVRLKRCQEA
ncbi:hypothetical protein BJ508DRAFT_412578 [Ascobolus immersus RN42]|uniref:Uncharacterized protein n=1 Tax=Ascobolus immersus RN42 TaxID=1160509 RepID=A0A3N4IJZ1_ASCIM|nr:hypothetical protein BJ508DRAFT_412578 [Ascobolus immersus RN42]